MDICKMPSVNTLFLFVGASVEPYITLFLCSLDNCCLTNLKMSTSSWSLYPWAVELNTYRLFNNGTDLKSASVEHAVYYACNTLSIGI